MKRFLLPVILFFVLLTAGCSKDDDNTDLKEDVLGECTGGLIPFDGISDIDNVSIWFRERQIVFNDPSDMTIERDVRYYKEDNYNGKVKWATNGQILKTEEIETFDKASQKYIITNTVIIDVRGIEENLTIEAIVEFKNRKARRFKTIPVIKVNE